MTSTHARFPSYVDDQREFFDRLITEQWHTYSNQAWDQVRRLETRILFRRIKAERVLDVGCGVGFHDLLMVEHHGVREVVGIDYSVKSVEAAERTYPHPQVTREVADLFEMRPGGFDLAVSFQVIEHLRDPAGFIAACARQVRGGGHVAVFTPNRLRFNNRVLIARGRTPQLADPQHYRELSRPEIADAGREAGLEPVSSFGYGLSITVPKLGKELIPRRVSSQLGRLVPAVADGIGVILRVPESR